MRLVCDMASNTALVLGTRAVFEPYHEATQKPISESNNYRGNKNNYEKMKQGNNDCDAFPPRKLQVEFGNIISLRILK